MNPSHDRWQVRMPSTTLPPRREKQPEKPESERAPEVIRAKKRNTLAMVMICWIGFMAFLVFVATRFSANPSDSDPRESKVPASRELSMGDRKFLDDHFRQVMGVLVGYAVSSKNEQRSQFVADPIRVAPRIDNYFSKNPLIRLDPENLKVLDASVLDLDGRDAIEIAWASQEEKYESVFVQQGDGWKLDWEHFAQYGDELFSMFLAGHGPSEAEFRLYARERLAEERQNEPEISVVFYSPVLGKPQEFSVESPEFLVPRKDHNGRRLSLAFAMKQRGERAFGSVLGNMDPEDMIRVRVRLRRQQRGGEKTFQIVDVAACHWLGVTDDPGVPDTQDSAIGNDSASQGE